MFHTIRRVEIRRILLSFAGVVALKRAVVFWFWSSSWLFAVDGLPLLGLTGLLVSQIPSCSLPGFQLFDQGHPSILEDTSLGDVSRSRAQSYCI